MIGIRYLSAAINPSGYGQAARNFIASLYIAGIPITCETISQMADSADYGWSGNLVNSLEDLQIDYKVKILHITPDLYPKYIEKGKFNIAHLFWETDRLPKEWINPCNQMNEIWTLSEQQGEMIKNSGVSTPIKCFLQPVNTIWADSPIPPYKIPNFDGLVFYSIFQWIDRKNPRALLETYWKTFEGVKDVALILKTYRVSYSDKEFEILKAEINRWKFQFGLKNYPKTLLIKKLFNTQELFRLHKSCDILVSTSRGEGNRIPYVEASLMGNPFISIDKTGITDLLPRDVYYPIPATLIQATQVHWIPWYTSDQSWYDIDVKQLADTMLECYNNRVEIKERGKKAQNWVKDNLNYHKIGKLMKERLIEIERFL